MRAGKLRDRLTFQRRGVELSGYVSGAAAWGDLYTSAAAIKPVAGMSASEKTIADLPVSFSGFMITVRDCSELAALTANDRAIDARNAARVFDIRHIMRPEQTRADDIIIFAEIGAAAPN